MLNSFIHSFIFHVYLKYTLKIHICPNCLVLESKGSEHWTVNDSCTSAVLRIYILVPTNQLPKYYPNRHTVIEQRWYESCAFMLQRDDISLPYHRRRTYHHLDIIFLHGLTIDVFSFFIIIYNKLSW